MLQCLMLLCVAVTLHADSISLPAEYLDSNNLDLSSGTELLIYGTEVQSCPNLANLNWTGGTLRLEGCQLQPAASLSSPGLPLRVMPGQLLELSSTTISSVDTALIVEGGELSLQDVTLSATDCNIRSTHPESLISLDQVRICNAETGLDLHEVQSASLNDVLFLTNQTALISTAGALSLNGVMFQANETALRIEANAQLPLLGVEVDFFESRYTHIDNQTTTAIDLGTAYLDSSAGISGPWLRSGTEPGMLWSQPELPIIPDDGDDDVFRASPGEWISKNGIPLKPSMMRVYHSNSPYSGYDLHQVLLPGESTTLQPQGNGRDFYRTTIVVGEWVD